MDFVVFLGLSLSLNEFDCPFRSESLNGLQFDTSIDLINIPTGSKKQQKMFHIRNGENFYVYSHPKYSRNGTFPRKNAKRPLVVVNSRI